MSAAAAAKKQPVESLCVAVLAGGRSSEREVSLKSGKGIARALPPHERLAWMLGRHEVDGVAPPEPF